MSFNNRFQNRLEGQTFFHHPSFTGQVFLGGGHSLLMLSYSSPQTSISVHTNLSRCTQKVSMLRFLHFLSQSSFAEAWGWVMLQLFPWQAKACAYNTLCCCLTCEASRQAAGCHAHSLSAVSFKMLFHHEHSLFLFSKWLLFPFQSLVFPLLFSLVVFYRFARLRLWMSWPSLEQGFPGRGSSFSWLLHFTSLQPTAWRHLHLFQSGSLQSVHALKSTWCLMP